MDPMSGATGKVRSSRVLPPIPEEVLRQIGDQLDVPSALSLSGVCIIA